MTAREVANKVRVFVATFIAKDTFGSGAPVKGMYLFLEVTKTQKASNLICFSEDAVTCGCKKCRLNKEMAKSAKCEYLLILEKMKIGKYKARNATVFRLAKGAIFSSFACSDFYNRENIVTFFAQNVGGLFEHSVSTFSKGDVRDVTEHPKEEKDIQRFILNAQLNRGTQFVNLPSVFSDLMAKQILHKLQAVKEKKTGALKEQPKEPSVLDGVRKKVLRPEEKEFFVTQSVWDQLLYSLSTGSNTLLLGPSGCGKSELLKMLSDRSGRPLFKFNFGAMTEPRTALLGNVNLDPGKGTWFSKSRFVEAIQTPNAVVMLDELSRAPIDAFNILLPLLDGQKYLSLDEREDKGTVTTAEGVAFLATANIGMEYTGTGTMDRALRDRFVSVDLEFPPEDKEIDVICHRTKISKMEASWLVIIANRQRKLAKEGQYVEQISTRILIQVANQVVFGIKIREALAFGLESLFSAEGGTTSDRTKVMQIVRAVIPVARMKETDLGWGPDVGVEEPEEKDSLHELF